MADRSRDNSIPKDDPPRFSRNDTLKFVGFGTLGTLALETLTILGADTVKKYRSQILEEMEMFRLDTESRQLINEITEYRTSLGLEGLPKGVDMKLLENSDWQPTIEFTQGLDVKNKSYGLYILQVIKEVFGDNAARIVRGAKTDPKFPYGMSFDPSTRFCNVSDTVHSIPIEGGFVDYILHEACGHGSDPAVGANYPTKTLIHVLHGRWRALSQAFSIPGQFFEHPGDLMFPLLKKSVGETAARYLCSLTNEPIVNIEAMSLVFEAAGNIAKEKGLRFRDLKYNKSVCKRLGEVLIELVQMKKLRFEGGLKATYQDSIESSSVEIYAEMMKYAILYPEKIGFNIEVLEGIQEVIGAIGGNTDLVKLRFQITNPTQEITQRNIAEAALIEKPEEYTKKTLTPEEIARAQEQAIESEKKRLAFENLTQKGSLPSTLVINEAQKELVLKFASIYSVVIHKYPMLENTFAQQHDESFDPEMHIWDIRLVESAMDSGFTRQLIESTVISDQVYGEIQRKVAILESFVVSKAF